MTLKEFQETIQSLTTQYGNDPEVMARLQQMLMSYGLIGPDGRSLWRTVTRTRILGINWWRTLDTRPRPTTLLVKTVEAAEANFGFQEWIDP